MNQKMLAINFLGMTAVLNYLQSTLKNNRCCKGPQKVITW